MALRANPTPRVDIPSMTAVLDRSERRLDVVPAALILERTPHGLGDEGAATSASDPAVELRDQLVVEVYVQAHAHTLTHN